ncbi:transposase [Mesorhizobium sp. M0036]|uniref:transposase n=1 Tax=Mesorhizobium sp. M0036 TaxID=2956853 RepID=UPI00333974C9
MPGKGNRRRPARLATRAGSRTLAGFAWGQAHLSTFMVEIGDVRRFANPRQLMAYLGLVPSERSTGNAVRWGGITKTGNAGIPMNMEFSGLLQGALAHRLMSFCKCDLRSNLDEQLA